MCVVAGIDYSLTSPSIVVHSGNDWSLNNCKIYYIAKTDKTLINNGILNGSLYPSYDSQYERYQKLASWSLKILLDNGVEKCYIEDYAYAAKGKVFHIAENTGLLKYSMWNLKIDFTPFAPKEIKKFATNNGNADKSKMYLSWLNETSYNLRHNLNITSEKMWNPISDIVDAYYIAKYGFEKDFKHENKKN